MNQLAIIADPFGNVICRNAYVLDITAATTTAHTIGGDVPPFINAGSGASNNVDGTFLGGSGDSFEFTGTLDDPAPLGIYARTEENIWQFRQFTLTGDPATGAELSDEDDIVATITGAYTGFPDGTYTLTTYGEDTYNAGNAGTIDGEQEVIATTVAPFYISATIGAGTEIVPNIGTAADGEYELSNPAGSKIAWSGTAWELLDEFGVVMDTGPSTQYDPSFDYEYDPGTGIITIEVRKYSVKSISTVDFAPATVQSGNYTRTDWCEWTSDDDPDFTITVNVDGTADISDATDIIATRSNEVFLLSQGVYNSTTYGADTYNDGAPFVVTIGYVPAMPLTLWVWLEIALNAGAFDGATGPFVGTSLPANSATKKVYPIYYSNGLGEAKQFTFGPIIWT